MDNYFDIVSKHIITAANRNKYAIPMLHPNRKMIEHDFIYMLEGEWTIGQNNETFTIQKGDVLILYANQYHYGITSCSTGTKTMFIHALHNTGDNHGQCSTFEKIILPSHIKAGATPAVKNCFEKVIYAKSYGNEIMASVYFDALLCELESCANKTTRNSLAENIRQMIVSSSRILKNSEIAEKLNVSMKTAENTFKKAFHTTIHQYVIDTKLEHVKFYLVNFPDMKLYEIATNLGFYDEFHLSRHFKKAVGVSPGEYRKRKCRTK